LSIIRPLLTLNTRCHWGQWIHPAEPKVFLHVSRSHHYNAAIQQLQQLPQHLAGYHRNHYNTQLHTRHLNLLSAEKNCQLLFIP